MRQTILSAVLEKFVWQFSDPRIVHDGSGEMGKTKTVPGESWNEDEMTRSLTVFLILINAYMIHVLIHILLFKRESRLATWLQPGGYRPAMLLP